MKYAIILEKATKNYSAYAPDVPGCIATADTFDETVQMMKEALEFHFDGLHADGDPIPQPESEVAYVELDWTPSPLNPVENDDPLLGLEEDPREELHDLLDEIPEGDIAKVKAFLESLVSGSGVDLVELEER